MHLPCSPCYVKKSRNEQVTWPQQKPNAIWNVLSWERVEKKRNESKLEKRVLKALNAIQLFRLAIKWFRYVNLKKRKKNLNWKKYRFNYWKSLRKTYLCLLSTTNERIKKNCWSRKKKLLAVFFILSTQ